MPSRNAARLAFRRAIESGALVRPDKCESCGAQPGAIRGGNPGIVGHHADYNAPLDVDWLCFACHKQWHAKFVPWEEGESAA